MSDNQPKFITGEGWRYDLEHSMHRRMRDHDYQGRSIYMITLCTQGRVPLLARLQCPNGNADNVYIEPTELGIEVMRCWKAIPQYHPEVRVLGAQLMPDHIHGLLFVTREMEQHLGKVVNGFKVGCNRAYRRLVLHQEVGAREAVGFREAVGAREAVGFREAMPHDTGRPNEAGQPNEAEQPGGTGQPNGTEQPDGTGRPTTTCSKHPERGMLFEPGYQDSVLSGKEQLEHMWQYMADNPRRLAIKRLHPDLFKVVSELRVGNRTFAAIGNRWLLDRPVRMQVRCHNNKTPQNLRLIGKQKDYFLGRGAKGGVVVSPCISDGEKKIARAALDAKQPLIVILENGFPPIYKPPGQYFEACAKGLLLMLAPWPYHMEKRLITRAQCLELNQMAYEISTEPWTDELERSIMSSLSF